MSQTKKTLKWKKIPFVLAGIFFLSSLIATASLFMPASSVSAETQADCEARGGTWQYAGTTLSCVGGTAPGNSVSAIPLNDITANWTPQQVVQSALYERALVACMESSGAFNQYISNTGAYSTLAKSAATLSNWWNTAETGGGRILDGDVSRSALLDQAGDGILNCQNENEWLSDAFNLWQISSNIEALCIFGWYRFDSGMDGYPSTPGSYSDCLNGSGDALTNTYLTSSGEVVNNTSAVRVIAGLKQARGISITLDKAHTYLLYRYVFEQPGAGCGAKQYVKLADANPDQKTLLDGDGAVKVTSIETSVDENGEPKYTPIEYIYQFQEGTTKSSTVEIASYLADYPLYIKNGGSSSPARDGKNQCDYIASVMNSLLPSYLTMIVSGEIDNGAATQLPGCTGSDTTCDPTTTCAVPGVGWIVCPIFNLMAQISDATYGVIANFLKVDVKIFETGSGTYEGWLYARNIANIGFVILFLIIVFSQISSIGINNYGVKKLIPRLIIAAILVNASYFVCQLAVDVSNILGSSVENILKTIPVFRGATDFWSGNNALQNVVGEILAGAATLAVGAAVGYAAVMTGVGLLVPILLGAVLAVAVTFLILVARQAIVVLLIVLSPLAFLAMLLPNTENYFKQWRKLFIAMLVLFPMIALLYGGSRLAGGILLNALADKGLLAQLAAAAVGILPLIATPFLLKGSLNAIPIVGNLAAKLQSRANGVAGRGVKEFARNTPIARGWRAGKQRRAEIRDEKFADSVMKGKGAGGIARVLAGREGRQALERQAFGATEDADTKNVNFQAALLARKARSGEFKDANGKARGFHDAVGGELEAAIKAKDSVRARAAIKALEDSGERGLEKATSVMSSNINTISNPENRDLKASLLSYTHSLGLKGRDNRLNKWADEGDDSVLSGDSHLQGLSFRELASQTNESLQQALDVNKNAISQEDARQIMAGVANGTIDMKTGPKMELFRALAEGKPLPPRNNNTPPASTP